MFQSTPVIADERIFGGGATASAVSRFQSTPVIADERIFFRACRRSSRKSRFQSTPVIADERIPTYPKK